MSRSRVLAGLDRLRIRACRRAKLSIEGGSRLRSPVGRPVAQCTTRSNRIYINMRISFVGNRLAAE